MEKTAAEEIKDKAATGDFDRIPRFAEVIVEQAYGENAYDGEELTLRLARLKERSQAVPQMAVKSSVPGAGLVKRLFAKLAAAVMGPAFRQQSQYQMELAGCMWDMKVRMSDGEKRLEERISGLERQKGELEERVSGLERQKGELEERVSGLERQKGELEERISGLERQKEELEERISGLERQKGELEERVSGLERQKEELEERISGLEKQEV